MDEGNVLDQNRLPGSEKLTRPEEIKQLSKYLKNIRETYDENLRLEDQVFGIPGVSTGKIPEISKLPRDYQKRPGNENQGKLGNKVVGIPGSHKDPKLSGKRLEVPDLKEYAKLRDTKKDLPENQGGEVDELRDKILRLSDTMTPELSEKRIDLDIPQDIALTKKRLDIQAQDISSLSEKRVDLEDNREIELGNKKLGLSDNREPELPNKLLKIQGDKETPLSQKRIDLYDSRDIKLPGDKIGLYDDRELSLSSKRINLSAEDEVELEKKRLDLHDTREIELPEKRLDLSDKRELSLSDKLLSLHDTREIELENKKLGLEDTRKEPELEDTRIDLKDTREIQLENTRIDISDTREIELENKKLDLSDTRELSLSDKLLQLQDLREVGLEKKRLDLSDTRENQLSGKRVNLQDDRENQLITKRVDLEDTREIELSEKRLGLEDTRELELSEDILGIPESENGEPVELYDQYLGIPDNENGEPTELYDQYLGMPDNENEDISGLVDKISSLPRNINEEPAELEDKIVDLIEKGKIRTGDDLKSYVSDLPDSELYKTAMKIASEGEDGSGDAKGWFSKVSSLMSAYLSSPVLLPKRAIEFRDAINNTLEMSYFGSAQALRVPVDTSSGTIWAKAEEAVGDNITGTTRRDALDEMIVKMVNYKKSNLPRIPGSDLGEAGVSGLKNVAGLITGSTSHPNPMNKPLSIDGLAMPGGYGDTTYQAANNRTDLDSLDKIGDTIGGTFYSRYWSAPSFKQTLEELCPVTGNIPIVSYEQLKLALQTSPYITTPGKFMTDTKGSYNTFSLDSNIYWEIVMSPYCCESGNCNNGGMSYLPAIQEINTENRLEHGVLTRYGDWLPITSFELQKSKLVTKSVPLYDGEIVYPVGMEFTNDLRLTFVDDSWKSMRRYFEKCAQVAVYNSEPHGQNYYENYNTEFFSHITKIDKRHNCIALYKNITFDIRIYVLSPQKNTLRKFDLLCVLKDFTEEYIGEIDAGGTDLNVTFSVVGENPTYDSATSIIKDISNVDNVKGNLAARLALEAQKRYSNGINSSIGLI